MAHLDDVTQRLAAELCRQQFEEAAEVAGIEYLGGCELPEQGAEMPAEFGYAGIKKALIESPASLSTRRLVAKRGPFSENLKPFGTSLAHLR